MKRLLLEIHKHLPKPLRKWLFQLFSLSQRAMTLGVRIYATNGDGQVLLVKHTYVSGWHLPGGCVERGETVQETATKELLEETGLEAASTMELIHIYKNPSHSKYDHVALFKCIVKVSSREFSSNDEISEIGFFNPNDLPIGITKSTRNRIAELKQETIETEIW